MLALGEMAGPGSGLADDATNMVFRTSRRPRMVPAFRLMPD
jgi:hypothetical protein